MPPALAKEFAGLPRWAWLAILGGGLVIGLVIRSRMSGEEETEDTGEEEYTDDVVYQYEDEYVGDIRGSGYMLDPTEGGGGFYYQGPPLPTAVAPNITVNVGGKGNSTGKKCKGKRPKRKPPKGTHWGCRNGLWAAIPNRRAGSKGKGIGGRKIHPTDPPRPMLTSGGPPDRRNNHRANGQSQSDIARRVLVH